MLTNPLGTKYHHLGYGWLQRTAKGAIHPAVDLNGKGGCNSDCGLPVYAMANGKVVGSSDIKGHWFGECISIKHPQFGVFSIYAHLSKRTVRIGNTVKQGQLIGTVGKTYGWRCCHLHFEVRRKPRGGMRKWVSGWSISQVKKYYENPLAFISSHTEPVIVNASLNPNTSIVDYLKYKGMPSGFLARRRLYRRAFYTWRYWGNARQNTRLLEWAKRVF